MICSFFQYIFFEQLQGAGHYSRCNDCRGPQKLGEGHGLDSPLEPPRGSMVNKTRQKYALSWH